MSKFVKDHPGGEEVLVEYGGKDATKAFEDIGHSKKAHNLLSKLEVGYLQGYKIKHIDDDSHKDLPKAKEMEAFVLKRDGKHGYSRFVEFFVPLLVFALYFGYMFMTEDVDFGS